MKTYRIISEPTYGGDGSPLLVAGYTVGASVHVLHDDLRPDGDGDVKAYLCDAGDSDWRYLNARHLAPADTDPATRAEAVREAVEILGKDALVDDVIKLADYLQGGAA